ncbi:2-carboxy-1,4-naphthoquinone phytyltransferase, chloroplastic-like [Henckelia pumila]|uniref:2-carboxy-1,4-naphthoquinone phytyltransferase, chloroplastic-like n=1 Tax=Henckelia pumila TaxID=405737 RepID=UPI003C6E4634
MAANTIFLNVNINGCGINQDHMQLRPKRNFSVSSAAPPQALHMPRLPQRKDSNKNTFAGDVLKSSTKIINNSTRLVLKYRAEAVEVADLNNASVHEEIKLVEEEELSRATLLWRAAKIPLYSVALVPATVASALAFWQTGQAALGRYFMILASFVIVNIWIKLSNDVYDFDTGADKNKKESVVNIFGSRNAINYAAWTILAIGFSGFTGLAVAAKSVRAFILVAASVFCFYIYQCPPYRVAYDGLGEPTLFTGFGPLATIGFYLLHSTARGELPISNTVVWSSILVGYTTTLILFCSHFHQIEDDKAVGKMSPLVRLGTKKASKVLQYGVVGLYALLFGLGYTNTIPLASVIFGSMTLPIANLLLGFVQKNYENKVKLFKTKYFCVGLHTLLGLAVSAGLVLARILARQPVAL